MGQSNLSIQVRIETGQAKGQVEDLSRTIADLNEQLNEAVKNRDTAAISQIAQALNSATASRGAIMNQAKQSEAAQQAQASGGIFGGANAHILQHALDQIVHGFLDIWGSAYTAAKQRASGDFTGAEITKQKAWGGGLGQAGGMIAGGIAAALTVGFGPFGMALVALGGTIGKFVGEIKSKKTETDMAFSQQYKNAFSGIDSLNQNYGGAINIKDAEENNLYGLEMRTRAVEAATGTGLDTEDFIQALKQTAAYGIGDETKAMNMTQNQALWARYTGADLGAVQKVGGMAARYGGEGDAASLAYGGLKAQNMERGQFTEYLNSLGRVFEEGISKGFTKSTEEIAGNMAMLYKLSGGSPLWQGEQGAQRLSQMNNAIASATNLQSVEDAVSYAAAKNIWDAYDKEGWELGEKRHDITYTGTYADVMQLLERGLGDGELLKEQWAMVKKLDGGNEAATIERFKTMYGMNYAGASQVWAMYKNAGEDFDPKQFTEKIKQLQETPEYKSDSATFQDINNVLDNILVHIGSYKFDKEMQILENTQLGVEKILAKLERGQDYAVDDEWEYYSWQQYEDRYARESWKFEGDLERVKEGKYQFDDLNKRELGERFDEKIYPLLKIADGSMSDELMDSIKWYIDAYDAANGRRSEDGQRIGETELIALHKSMDNIAEALAKLGIVMEESETNVNYNEL